MSNDELLIQRCSYRRRFRSNVNVRKVKAKGRNPDALQAKFDSVVRETEEIADIVEAATENTLHRAIGTLLHRCPRLF